MTTLAEAFQVVRETPGQIDMSNIFPGAGTYFVQADAAVAGVNRSEPDHPRPYARIPLEIVKVESKPNSGLVGKNFSTFLSLDKVKSTNAQRAPISFTARAMYRLRNGEFPQDDNLDDRTLEEWMGELDGMRFVVQREVYKDDKGITRSRDTLISSDEWKEKAKLDGTPEVDPEAVAAQMTI